MKLLENGLHSYKKTIQNLKILDNNHGLEREIIAKEIVLSLHHSIETLFKHSIQEVEPRFVFSDLDQYFAAEINKIRKKGKTEYNGNTITFMESVKRAIILNKQKLTDNDYCSIEHLNYVRNAITHHEYDFTEKHINYLITQVLIVVTPIFNNLIPTFNQYVQKYDLNLNGSAQIEELTIWKFKRFFTIYDKIRLGKETIKTVRTTPGEFDKKQEIAKVNYKKFITFHKCPCCDSDYFVKEKVILIETEEKGYVGNCLICDIELNKEDAYFLYIISEDLDSIINKYHVGYSIVSEIFKNNDLNSVTNEELQVIKAIISKEETQDFLASLTNDFIHDKCYPMFEEYVDMFVGDIDSAEMDKGLFGNTIIRKKRSINNLFESHKEILGNIFSKFRIMELNESYYTFLFEEYEYETSRSHPNPNNDNVDEDIPVKIYIQLEDLSFFE
ncbi:hypothetical protein ACQKNX_07155 [Lysinibacillus sp. NPDC093712]|uniref:hypothetical protein n=1 Tax=Lysinibacillus sp. NPDC093712 TaxID=3390579 RepID=UPI003D0935F8